LEEDSKRPIALVGLEVDPAPVRSGQLGDSYRFPLHDQNRPADGDEVRKENWRIVLVVCGPLSMSPVSTQLSWTLGVEVRNTTCFSPGTKRNQNFRVDNARPRIRIRKEIGAAIQIQYTPFIYPFTMSTETDFTKRKLWG
jgi:hypothetical protein